MEKIYDTINPGSNAGECPVCNGTGKRPCPDNLRYYGKNNGWYGYVVDTDGKDYVDCNNCGAQYMYTKPQGVVRLNKEGKPCTHEYEGVTVSNCYHRYICKHCGDTHFIDSGD